MTDRERLVEVMARSMKPGNPENPPTAGRRNTARKQLAALEAAGFEVYRPDDCRKIVQGAWRCRSCGEDCRLGEPCPDADYDDRTYYLVPVGGDS